MISDSGFEVRDPVAASQRFRIRCQLGISIQMWQSLSMSRGGRSLSRAAWKRRQWLLRIELSPSIPGAERTTSESAVSDLVLNGKVLSDEGWCSGRRSLCSRVVRASKMSLTETQDSVVAVEVRPWAERRRNRAGTRRERTAE